MNLDQLTDALLQRMEQSLPRALLVGQLPENGLQKYNYVNEEPYEAVVIGKLSPGRLLQMPDDRVCSAILEGLPVYMVAQGWNKGKTGMALRRELCRAEQRLKSLGAVPWETVPGLVTADRARLLRQTGGKPAPGSRLTPLARDILEGKEV